MAGVENLRIWNWFAAAEALAYAPGVFLAAYGDVST